MASTPAPEPMAVDTTSGTAHESAAEAAATSSRVDTTSGTAQESAAEAAAAADSATPGQKETTAERRRKQAKEKANAENKKKDIAARITKYKLVRPKGRSVIWDYAGTYSAGMPRLKCTHRASLQPSRTDCHQALSETQPREC